MARPILENVLAERGKHYAAAFLHPDRKSFNGKRFVDGPSYVLQDLHNLDFKDEHKVVRASMLDHMGKATLTDFERLSKGKFPKREDAVFHKLLRDKLAISPDGNHIDGLKGTSVQNGRLLGRQMIEVEAVGSILYRNELKRRHGGEIKQGSFVLPPRLTYFREAPLRWHIFAGEEEERDRIERGLREFKAKRGESEIDPFDVALPHLITTAALHPNFSAEATIAGLDAMGALMDEGTAAGFLQGRTGAQPADPDAATTGVLLFSCEGSDPFWNAAVDDADGSCSITADAISDDTAADNTNTLTYIRGSAANTTITELDNHIDGEASTSGSDWTVNTTAIVAGATVQVTSMVVGQSQGPDAT